MLGTIDAPEKVFWVMWANGYAVDGTQWVRMSGGGYEAIGTKMTQDCFPITG